MSWVVRSEPRRIIDTARYEAFPQVVRTASGRLIMTWASSDQHYATDSVGKISRSDDHGSTWSAPMALARPDPAVPRVSVPGLATLGGRVAAMTMCPSPYRGFIQLSQDDGLTWTTPKQIGWSSTSWTFPSWLAWLPSDTSDGLMLATCYGGEGVILVASADAGQTWTRRANPVTGTVYNESSVTLLSDGRLLLLVRHETSSSIHALWSSDMGYTWSAPQMVVPHARSLPACTQMPDGTLLLPIRDDTVDADPENWALASSTDLGVTWTVQQISTQWMMYGQVVATGPTSALLIGASQDRTSAYNADIFQLRLGLRAGTVALEAAVSRTSVRLRAELPSGMVGQPLTITATAAGGESRVLRGWDQIPAPAIAVAIDHEAELVQDVRYALLVDGVEYDSVTVRIEADLPVITDPIRGLHIPVIIQEWPEERHERVGSELDIAGMHAPLIIDGLERTPTSTITLIHPPEGRSAAALAALLSDSSIIRVRPSCANLPTVWASARARRRRRFAKRPGSAFVDEIELRHIAQPEPDTQAVGNTLQDLHDAVPGTLADIEARWPGVLADIAYEDLTA